YISAADIVFGRRDAQGCRHEVKGDVAPEVAESPKLHRVQVVDFPGLFAPYVQLGGECKSVDDHSPAQVGKIEGFAVVAAKHQAGRLRLHQVGEGYQQLPFIGVGKRFQTEAHLALTLVEHAHRYAD